MDGEVQMTSAKFESTRVRNTGATRTASALFPRFMDANIPTAVRGDGVYIYDSDGNRYLDASGCGVFAASLGYSHPDVIDAAVAQLRSLPFVHCGSFTSEPAEELAHFLVERAPQGISRVFFTSGGSEAIEVSAVLALQYFVEIGRPSKKMFISRTDAYHGANLTSMALGDLQHRRRQVAHVLLDVGRIPTCYPYRYQAEGESEGEYALRAADELEKEILRIGPQNVAAFFAETVPGAMSGVLPPAKGYFKRIREICDKYDVLLVLDEVMCGMGRTGTLFACEQESVSPDLLAVAKSLGGSFIPLGASLVSERVVDALRKGSRGTGAGYTYMQHPVACAAALAAQRAYAGHGLVERVSNLGPVLRDLLHSSFAGNPYVGDIRGRGFLWALELVTDRKSKSVFAATTNLQGRIAAAAKVCNLIIVNAVVQKTGANCVALAPAYITEETTLREIVATLRTILEKVFSTLDQPYEEFVRGLRRGAA